MWRWASHSKKPLTHMNPIATAIPVQRVSGSWAIFRPTGQPISNRPARTRYTQLICFSYLYPRPSRSFILSMICISKTFYIQIHLAAAVIGEGARFSRYSVWIYALGAAIPSIGYHHIAFLNYLRNEFFIRGENSF
jgi:hypothetical protein